MQINACVAKKMLKTFDEYNTINETFESEQQAQELSGSDKNPREVSDNPKKIKIMKHKMDQTAEFMNRSDMNKSMELQDEEYNEDQNEEQDHEVTGTRGILKKISELTVSNKQCLFSFIFLSFLFFSVDLTNKIILAKPETPSKNFLNLSAQIVPESNPRNVKCECFLSDVFFLFFLFNN